MHKRQINLQFARHKETELFSKAKTIIDALKDNERFPPPIPYLPQVIDATEDYKHALSRSGHGKETTLLKKHAREKLISNLQQLGRFLSLECKGDVAAMLSTGFTVSKVREPKPIPPKPSGFSVKATEAGRVKLKCERISFAHAYQWEWREVTENNWQWVTTTKASNTLNNLDSGKQYVFRVRASGSKGPGPYSDEIKSWVL